LLPAPEGIARALREPLLKVFPAALLGRLVVVPYAPLSDAMLGNIIRLQLDRIGRRIAEQHRIAVSYADDVPALIAARCNELESGARVVDAILTNTMLPRISAELLSRSMGDRQVARIAVSVRDGEFEYSFD